MSKINRDANNEQIDSNENNSDYFNNKKIITSLEECPKIIKASKGVNILGIITTLTTIIAISLGTYISMYYAKREKAIYAQIPYSTFTKFMKDEHLNNDLEEIRQSNSEMTSRNDLGISAEN